MSCDAILSALTAVRKAIDADDFERLDAATARLNDEYDAVKTTERARVARLQAANTEADLTREQRGRIRTYQQRFITTHFGRGGLLAAISTYQLAPADCDAAELRAQITELADREKALHEAIGPTDAVLQGVELPPRLGILSFSTVGASPALGEQIQAELVCENVGDEPTTGVTVDFSADTCGVQRTTTVGAMAPRDRETIMFELSASAGDHVELAGVVNSDTAGAVEDTTTVVVRTRSAIVTTALETVTELLEALQECGEPAERLRPLTTNLTAARNHLQRAQTALGRSNTVRATDAISTASTRLGAVLNHLATKEMSDCFATMPHVHRTLRTRTELVIDHLTDATSISETL